MGFDISKFLAGLDEGKDRAIKAGEQAVDQYANRVVGKAQKLAPKLTGALAGSGIAEKAQFNGHDIRATVGFNTNYAAAVHERLDVHHENGQAKFLETPMRTEAPKLPPFVEKAMRSAL